jgi:hypothetical protein
MEKNKHYYEKLKKTIQFELDHFPLAKAKDLAKLLYQSMYGPQHAVQLPEKLYEWLEQEMQDLDPKASEPLIQPVWLHYPMFRLHLSTASKLSVSLQQIHELFLQSCTDPTPSPSISWNEAIDMTFHILLQRKLPESQIQANEFKDYASSSAGPYHHSANYREAYHPHYRLVSFHAIQQLISPNSILFIEAQGFLC